MILRGANSILTIFKFSIFLIFLLFLPLYSYGAETVYTIQTGTFINTERAQKHFDSLTQKLDEDKLDFLRIEKVGKYHTVRLGKFENKSAAEELLRVVTQQSPGAFLLKAYIIDKRIVRRHSRKSLPRKEAISDNDTEAVFAKVRELIKEGNNKDALTLLLPFISGPMKYPEAVSDYLVILVWEGRLDDAVNMYENLPAQFPRRPYLLRNMAKAYYDRKEFEKAASLYNTVIKKMPSDEEAKKGLVLSLIQTGEYARVMGYLEEFLEENPESVFLTFNKAHLLFRQGRYLESLKVYRVLLEREDVDSEKIYKTRDDQIVSLSTDERLTLASALFNAFEGGKESAWMDYMLVLILNKDYKTAISVFETANLDVEQYSDHLLSWIAWAYFKTGNSEKAKLYYQEILSKRPDYVRANIGLAYCLAAEEQGEKAVKILDKLLLAEPDNLDILFARAFVFEKLKMFWSAISEYDRILEIAPGNIIARRLKLQNLSDLGASSLALEKAYIEFPDDIDFHKSIRGDMAVDRINWKETVEAMSILLPLLEDREDTRARFDHLIALAENDDMEAVVEAYEELVKEEISLPPWVLENVAKAYLYLEKPHKALELYNKALEMNPASYDGRMGKFYTLQEIRDWDGAEKILNDLDREQPDVLGQGKLKRPNWLKLEVSLSRAWHLAYEERFGESKDLFWNYRERAPANMGVRTGLAHAYFWRGWPRKALREFRIINNLKRDNLKAKIGMIAVLNELVIKEEAREGADKLLTKYPKNKHVQQLVRQFEVDEMRELITDFVYTKDEDGFEDIRAEITLSQPLTLYTNFYGFLLRQQSSKDDNTRFYRRIGLGIDHIFNSSWRVRQQLSINYDNGDDFGSFTRINYSPDDYWNFSLSYDSFTTDVSLRARVFGIEADKVEAGIAYRESEWRNYYLSLTRLKFSDGNDREQAMLGYEQGLLVKNNWRMRLFLDLYTSRNSRDDAPYFNPDHDLSLSATHMTEYTHWRIYNRAFLQKLFLTLGTYKQSGFQHETIGSVRYEHNYDFSDTQALLWGVTAAKHAYDGEPVQSYSFYLTYRGRF